MPLASPANNWLVGWAKQTNESTIATTSIYTVPVYSGRPQPVQTEARIEVTDAAGVIGDPYKTGDEHWEMQMVTPAFAAPLGSFLVSMWPTDAITGSGPFTHTYSGLGGTTAWFATYSDPLTGALDETFEAGLCTGISFTGDAAGGPIKVGVNMIGKRPTRVNWTPGGTAAMTDGYFTAKGGTLKYEADNATPATRTNIQDFAIVVNRPGAPVPTADSTSVSLINQGRVEFACAMTLIYDGTWDEYQSTYYGTVAGTTPSLVYPVGSVELNFIHSVNATWTFKLTIDKAWLKASPPQPDPAGSPILIPITIEPLTPASGSHIKPVLVNAVSAAY